MIDDVIGEKSLTPERLAELMQKVRHLPVPDNVTIYRWSYDE